MTVGQHACLSWQRGVRWTVVLAYFLATSLGHLVFTEWLLRPRVSAWWGAYAFKDAVPAALVAGGLAMLARVWHTARRDPRGFWATGRYWLLWLVCVAAVDRLLTYSIYEYAHYPQYALLAAMIMWALGSRSGHVVARVLFWTTLLGAVDEWMQYLWITPGYGNYLDFNDVLVNLLGAAAGVMLVARRAPVAAQRRRRVEGWTAAMLALAVFAAFAGGRLQMSPPPDLAVAAGGIARGTDGVARLYLERAPGWYGSVQRSPHRGAYHVLSPGPALLLLLLIGGWFAHYGAPPRTTKQGESP